jgi:hypothetical protein
MPSVRAVDAVGGVVMVQAKRNKRARAAPKRVRKLCGLYVLFTRLTGGQYLST